MTNKHPKDQLPKFRIHPQYLLTVAMSWLVPGSGHWMLGYRVRGIVLAVSLLGTFWVGESVLANHMAVTRSVHPVFFGLQVGNGFSALVANSLWGEDTHTDSGQNHQIQTDLPRNLNLGILLCSVSGLLNLLVVLHILDPRTWVEASRRVGTSPSGAT